MFHQHFNTIGSTQVYLKDNLDKLKINENDILISCSEQTEGIGRRGNVWDTYPNSLAMSFTLKPNIVTTLTPLEIGLMAISYFHKKFNSSLFLKWPNDILTKDGRKCGGILCQYIDNNTGIVGLGANLGKINSPVTDSMYKHGLGNIHPDLELKNFDQERISKELYQECLENRYHDVSSLVNDFNKHCFHLNMDVFIHESGKDYIGVFKGIGKNGEAIVEIDSTIRSFLSSSLTILN